MDNLIQAQDTILRLLRIGLGAEDELHEVSDWKLVYEVALNQCVQPFVFDGYVKKYEAGAQIPEMPIQDKKRWIAASLNTENTYIVQEGVASKMAHIFADGGLRTYVLKGRIIAECYPIPKHRRSVDMDCFLASADKDTGVDAWELGNALMEQHGFQVSRGFYKNSSFMLPGLSVENHLFLTPFRGNKRLKKLEILLQRMLREDNGQDKIEGSELYRPPVMVSALFLIEHAFSHFLHEGLHLRHVTDWMMFSRFHREDIDWPEFQHHIDEFGFRRFYDAYVHVGEYIMGDRPLDSLTAAERQMMDSVWEGLDLHDTVKGFRGKLNLAGNTLRASWKYRLFSPISMFHALWIQVKGFLFDKHPSL